MPEYQRGYRWTTRQVRALLDDLRAFVKPAAAPARREFYCLQPVVVRRREDDGDWEVVDGQQRLTTIRLILTVMAERVPQTPQPYSLGYATRPGLAEYVNAPDPDHCDDDIDRHHIWAAREEIVRWCDAMPRWTDAEIVRCLTGVDNENANVRVIWYQLDANAKANAVFVRINVGKIALTSAELIRALLLRRDQAGSQVDSTELSADQARIARDWDRVERRLHDPSFWRFVFAGRDEPATRIGVLFDAFVRSRKPEGPSLEVEDPLRVFLAFDAWRQSDPKAAADPWSAWDAVQQLFRVLEDWYEDRVLYHLVGAIIATSNDSTGRLVTLLAGQRKLGRPELDRWLRGLAWRRVQGRGIEPNPGDISLTRAELEEGVGDVVDGTVYGQSSGPAHKIRNALLWFNVASALEVERRQQDRGAADPLSQGASVSIGPRFEFDAFAEVEWDIEHVRSVTEASPRDAQGRKRWLSTALNFVRSPAARARNVALGVGIDLDDLAARMEGMTGAAAPTSEEFGRAFADVRRLSGEEQARQYDHRLANLVLLDRGTNRSYKNAVFPAKRKEILALDRKGVFVPPATRNVFAKAYNPDADDLWLWGDADQRAYRRELIRVFTRFFEPLVAPEETP